MEISELKRKEENEWEYYINNSESSTFYHRIGWKNAVTRTYGYKSRYLIAKEDDCIKGVLPLIQVNSLFFGNRFISLPFGSYGGACAENEEVRNALIKEAIIIAKNEGLDYLELRNFSRIDKLATNDSYVTFVTDLDRDLRSIWKNVKRDKQRKVNKAKEHGLKVEWCDDLKTFYDIHTCTMKNMGSPTHGYKFFKNTFKEFDKNVRILVIRREDIPICSWFLIGHRNTLTSVWGSSLAAYNDYCPYELAYWEAIKYATKKGYRHFDIGRCLRNSGVFNYKERWGASSKQLYYQYYFNKSGKIYDLSQSNPNRQRFVRIWRRLPSHITGTIGPTLRSKIP